MDEDGHTADLTCTGGYQAYCCSGFVASSKTNTGNMFLYGQGIFSKRSLDSGMKDVILARSGITEVLSYTACALAVAAFVAESPVTFGVSLLGISVELSMCAASSVAVSAGGFAVKPSTRKAKGNPNGQPAAKKINLGTGNGQKANSAWPQLSYSSSKGGPCDCQVTYTCRYGMGWDEVCDNQRWAITYRLNQQSVFEPNALRPNGRRYFSWSRKQRGKEYRTAVQMPRAPEGARCELDEFPMGDLFESTNNNPQVCRLVNGIGNKRQGTDYGVWKRRQWRPCSSYRVTDCKLPPPLATWKFGSLPGNRGIGNMIGTRFITALGFDSQTANSLCFASYTYTDSNNNVQNTMVEDHGFRVLNDDPMFYAPMNWPRQNWKIDPGPVSNAAERPTSVNSAAHMRRDFPITVAINQSLPFDSEEEESSKLTCNAIYDEGPTLLTEDSKLAYDVLQFEDLLGNEIDGRSCDVIYADDEGGLVQLVVNEDGSVQYSKSFPEIPITSAEAHMPTAEAQIPGSPMDGNIPESTSVSYDVVMSQVTAAPHSADLEYHLRHGHRHHH